MKALAHDVERNLRAPLTGIAHAADRHGLPAPPEVVAAIRTGDTPAADRQRMQRHPPDILITTPESLFLILTSAARKMLASVRWVILDEVHAVAGTKRGSHLALSMERLEEVTTVPPLRIGLSATQQPLSTIAEFMGGRNHGRRHMDAATGDHRRRPRPAGPGGGDRRSGRGHGCAGAPRSARLRSRRPGLPVHLALRVPGACWIWSGPTGPPSCSPTPAGCPSGSAPS